MRAQSRTPDRSRTLRLVQAVVVFGVAIPLLLLGAMFAGGYAAGVEFGTIVFWYTAAAVVLGLFLMGWGRRLDAANPGSELLRSSATDYGREVSDGTYQRLPLPARLLLVLTGTVVIGWLLLILSL